MLAIYILKINTLNLFWKKLLLKNWDNFNYYKCYNISLFFLFYLNKLLFFSKINFN